MIVIADATPLNYLILIHQADLLPQLFDRVLIPPAVFDELRHVETPELVSHWITHPPTWLKIQPLRSAPDPSLNYLDAGEREAIALAEEIHADQLLLDEAEARREAARRKLPFIGTLGVLRAAARREFIDLGAALVQLQQTTFHVDSELIRSLLDEDAQYRKQRS
jgi:predicted nucleic acid-binding protein